MYTAPLRRSSDSKATKAIRPNETPAVNGGTQRTSRTDAPTPRDRRNATTDHEIGTAIMKRQNKTSVVRSCSRTFFPKTVKRE
ncbi:MAG: hypothetical protein EBS22_00790 [Acidimicrobiia bacterium]|nr:hypothetical protein [Acidimicrobiia bacterium]